MRRRALNGVLLGLWVTAACGESTTVMQPVQMAPEPAEAVAEPADSSNRAALVGTLIGAQHGSALDEEALQVELKALLERTPHDPFVLANLGTLSLRAGKTEAGLDYYEKWYERAETSAAGLALANELARVGEDERAEDIYRTLLRREPELLGGKVGLGGILYRRGALDEAWKVGVGLVRHHPAVEAGHALLAAVALVRRETGIAGLLIRRAKLAGAAGPSLAMVRGHWLEAKGELGDALMAYRRGAEAYPEQRILRAEFGRVSLQLEDFRGALESFERLLAADPTDFEAILGAALACRGLGFFERADGLYQQLVGAESPSPRVLWNRAVLLHHHMGRFAEAVTLYDTLERVLPTPRPSVYADLETARADALAAQADAVAAEADGQ